MSRHEAAGTPGRLWRNRLTLAGSALALLALLVILSLLFFDFVVARPSPYLGLFIFLILPGVMVLGIALVALGLLVARRRMRRHPGGAGRVEYYPRIDLNDPAHRRALMMTGVSIAAALPFIGLMSYEGYEYTDSNEFCGAVCHTVMEPQYVAHASGAHARVECATCHIGRGAGWYVRSKISGIRQIAAVAMRTYERPIPPAITALRPARETCERCHWPEKFHGDQVVTLRHFASDEWSTSRVLRMIVKTGGGDSTMGPPSGIHWHMSLGHDVEFVAVDQALQEIPWMRAIEHRTGRAVVYRSDGGAATDPPPDGIRRTMDCLDCHNRATHVFQPPAAAADRILNVDPELVALPYAKRQLVAVTAAAYPSRARAPADAVAALRGFYEREYPAVAAARRPLVERLAEAAGGVVERSSFPAMRVDWRTYPNNIGHLVFPGCFRCHDGEHVDGQGTPLSRECSTCHAFEVPAGGGAAGGFAASAGFEHPIELEGVHARLRCDRCHSGGPAPAATCEGCHADAVAFMAGTLEAVTGFDVEADPMDGEAECVDCHDLAKPTDAATLQAACAECHEEPEFEHMVADWRAQADRLLARAEAGAGPDARRTIAALRRAGLLHNIEATVGVLTALAESPAGPAGPAAR